MIQHLKIGVKIGGGFAVVLTLTIMVSYMGWGGMRNVVDRVVKSNNVEALVLGMLETREAGKSFLITRDKKYIAMVNDHIQKLKKLAAAARDTFSDPVNKKQMEDAAAGFDGYKKAFDKYAELLLQEGQIQAEWKSVGEQYTSITDEVLADVIIPQQKAALEAQDMQKFAAWSELEASLSGEVVKRFLYLRTTAIYYILNRSPEQWENVLQALAAVYDGIERWKALGRDETAIVTAARKATEGIKRYESAAHKLYEGIGKAEKANQEMLAIAIQVQELCATANADQKAKMETEIATTDTIILSSALVAIILGVLISVFITLAIIRPVRRAVELADAVAEGDLSRNIAVNQNDEIGVLCSAMMKMVKNLQAMVAVAEKIARGDLTVQVAVLSDKDALGHALKDMVGKLSMMLTEINVSASNVAAGSEQMNSTSQAMSQGATEQASSLEEISSSMNEIAAQTRQNAENATLANRLSEDAKKLAFRGNEQMLLMVSAMKEINDSSRDISKIIKVIDEIAFQTNLLALNAAVEAARAGKHGKGFAVVAEEVRNLAARSAKAAKETSDMIEGSVRKVDGGTDLADKTAEALAEIVSAAAKVTDLVGEIAAASNEQAQGVSQITQGLGQIDQVTQQNTAHAEESASAAEELSSQAMVLQQLVSTFKIQKDSLSVGRPQHKMLATSGMETPTVSWGASPAGSRPAEPVIALDDREFGKY